MEETNIDDKVICDNTDFLKFNSITKKFETPTTEELTNYLAIFRHFEELNVGQALLPISTIRNLYDPTGKSGLTKELYSECPHLIRYE